MREHGEFDSRVYNRILVTQIKYSINEELVARIHSDLDRIEVEMKDMDRPFLRVMDLRFWQLASQEVLDMTMALGRRTLRMGIVNNIVISPERISIHRIARDFYSGLSMQERRIVSTPEEAWIEIGNLGYSVPPVPDFVANPDLRI